MVIPSKLSARLFLLWFIQGIAASIWLGLLPTSAEKSLIFGYSAARLVLAIVLLALSASSVFLWILSRRSAFSIPAKFIQPILILCLVITISAPAGIMILRALGISSAYIYSAYAQRLAPLAAWLCLSALELCSS